jgi:hypothetical protein
MKEDPLDFSGLRTAAGKHSRSRRSPVPRVIAASGPFSEFTVGLDHVSLAVDSAEALAGWRRHLEERGVAHSCQRSEWGHHINLRDPDNIAVELFLLEPDEASAEILARADGVSY